MIAVCTWLAAGAGMSLLVAPVGFRYFSAWRSRGVGFYRPLGLILIGFLFWIFGVLGLTRNSLGGLAAALAPAAAWSVRTLWLDREGAFFGRRRSAPARPGRPWAWRRGPSTSSAR